MPNSYQPIYKKNTNSSFLKYFLIIFLILIVSSFASRFFVNQNNNIPSTSNANIWDYRILNWKFIITPTKDTYLADMMNWASQKLFLEVYNILDNKIFENILAAKARNIDTKIITESKQYGWSWYYQWVLNKLGWKVEVRNDQGWGTNFVHTKLILTEKNFAVQSANLTYSSFNKNREFIFFSEDKILQQNLEKIFLYDWNNLGLTPKDINPQLLVCPIDCKPKLTNILKNAKSILIAHQNLEDKDIIWLVQKIESKKIILWDEADYLKQKSSFGLNIKNLASPYLHGKAILVDDKYLIIWSFNLTKNSLENNREISIILVNPEIISVFKQQFEKDFEKAKY